VGLTKGRRLFDSQIVGLSFCAKIKLIGTTTTLREEIFVGRNFRECEGQNV